MRTFATQAASKRIYSDSFRLKGCHDVWCLIKESETLALEALTEEVESALEELALEIVADVIPDEVMTSLIEHLNTARQMDVPVA